jgi:hypothetical protein
VSDPEAFTIKMAGLWFMHLRHSAATYLAEAEYEIPADQRGEDRT